MAERRMPSVEDYPSAAIGSSTPSIREETRPKYHVKKRRSALKEIRNGIVGDDSPSSNDYFDYIFHDIIFPALRYMISDIGHGVLDMAMGTDRGRGRYGRNGSGDRTYISYDRYSSPGYARRRSRYDDDDYVSERRRSKRREVPTSEDLDDFLFDSRHDAEDLLKELEYVINKKGAVPVSYFLSEIGETIPGDFVCEDWGWYDLSRAEIKPTYDGRWRIIFPKLRPI